MDQVLEAILLEIKKPVRALCEVGHTCFADVKCGGPSEG